MTSSLIQRIKERRVALGWSQSKLSLKAELSENYVCRLENGAFRDPGFAKIEAIHDALGAAEGAADAVDSDKSEVDQ